jgi:hypothetical protein
MQSFYKCMSDQEESPFKYQRELAAPNAILRQMPKALVTEVRKPIGFTQCNILVTMGLQSTYPYTLST